MGNANKRYETMQKNMTYILCGNAGLFALYLVFAALGLVWLKFIVGIIAILISAGCFGFLYLSQEWRKKRSYWMTVAAAAIAICILASMILRYPRPNTYKDIAPDFRATQQTEMF